jgi:hypothetical protein
VAVHAAEFGIKERPLEMQSQTPGAGDRMVLGSWCAASATSLSGVQHRFPGCGHDRGDEAGNALRRVGARRDVDGVALVAVEQHVVGAVAVNVDHPGRDRV